MPEPQDHERHGSGGPAGEPVTAHVSPTGEEFEVLGRAGPVALEPAPDVPAEAREDLLVLKCDDLFLCARRDGDVLTGRVSGEGLYTQDTRFLSRLRVRLSGAAPVMLSSTVTSGYGAVIDATNPVLDGVPQETVNIRRRLIVSDRLHCEVAITSYRPCPIALDLVVELGADFADVFEVRAAARRDARGRVLATKLDSTRVVFAYVGEDGGHRETRVHLEPAASEVRPDGDGAVARWRLEIPPRGSASVVVAVEPWTGERAAGDRSLGDAIASVDHASRVWHDACTRIETDDDGLARLIDASLRDLHALLTTTTHGRLPAAGIPWYVAPFGRDSIWASLMALMMEPDVARETLLVLAALQAEADEPWRDAEPGKILHELRCGELARAGIIPHRPYYGTVDATPLFLVLAAGYLRWTGDLGTLTALRPALDAALRWIDEFGDLDGDGFIEYERRSAGGLLQQGWKDSHDSIMHADGTPAEGPIALVEAQAYVYLAKTEVAEVYDAFGDGERATALRRDADDLRRRFDAAFWDAEAGSYVLALDGRKRQVRSIASNQAHALYCGIADPEKAALVAERLMAPDMFSGWGLRTLSADSPAYNPMSYHNGSVWPHDNAIAAAGLKRYGHAAQAARIARTMLDVGALARDARLPELFCGFSRRDAQVPVAYPVACIPQAWAACTPFLLLKTLLGLRADARSGALMVDQPLLPPDVARLELHGLRIGEGSVSLSFRSEGGVTGFSLLEQHGAVRVTMSA
ncbi:amylo-alpha-1,6-glucosidase [Baekduia soli]|nr:amylo-alpha-1,6-glucosidase [Baekduia soli]